MITSRALNDHENVTNLKTICECKQLWFEAIQSTYKESTISVKNICIVKRKELRITLRRGYSSFCRLFQNRVEWSNGQYFPIVSFSIFSGDILRSISFLISNSGMFVMPHSIYQPAK